MLIQDSTTIREAGTGGGNELVPGERILVPTRERGGEGNLKTEEDNKMF